MERALTVGSLFSGIGGLDEGLEAAGMRVRWMVESDPNARAELLRIWSGMVVYGDVRTVDFRRVERVDVMGGGFPCQDVSSDGNKVGIGGEKSGLWSHYVRAIGEVGPRYVLVENVADLLVRGIDVVLRDLAALGYDAEWDCLPAATVGAPQRRDRLFLIAYPHGAGLDRGAQRYVWPETRIAPQQRHHVDGLDLVESGSWSAAPELRRMDYGLSQPKAVLRGLGNAVVPQIGEMIGGWIIKHARATGYLEEVA